MRIINSICYSLSLLLFLSVQVFGQYELDLLGSYDFESAINDVWGYESNGREYALVGEKSSATILDITNPENISLLFKIEGPECTWRDAKTYEHYAYFTNECGDGLLIIDLFDLPISIDTLQFTDNGRYWTAHNIFIDEKGFAYLCGFEGLDQEISSSDKGVLIYDLKNDPTQPEFIGLYEDSYVHDLYVKNDTMFTAEINNGKVGIIDVSDRSNPTIIQKFITGTSFTHNVWVSDSFVFTTDERKNAAIEAYDIANLNDIQFLDDYKANPGTNLIPHNVFEKDGYLIASYYTAGVRIIDANDPTNLIETAYYDTSPHSDATFNGCWGVYPYLSSNMILASDRTEGLFVLAPQYERASYLTGEVIDAQTGKPIQNAAITIDNKDLLTRTNILGYFSTGRAEQGNISVQCSKYGYFDTTFDNIQLDVASNTEILIELEPKPVFDGNFGVFNNHNLEPIENAIVHCYDEVYDKNLYTNGNGFVSFDDIIKNNYTMVIGKWGYRPVTKNTTLDAENNNHSFYLEQEYYDNFELDLGWTVTSNAEDGEWERVVPIGTKIGDCYANPNVDVDSDFGAQCYVTKNGTWNLFSDDLDHGSTSLVSPPIQFNANDDCLMSYSQHWFTEELEPEFRYISVIVKFEQESHVLFHIEDTVAVKFCQWNKVDIQIPKELHQGELFQIEFLVNDTDPMGGIMEAGIDDFSIVPTNNPSPTGLNETLSILVNPTVSSGEFTLHWQLNATFEEAEILIVNALGQVVISKTTQDSFGILKIQSDLAPGIYFATLSISPLQSTSYKFIKH